MEPSPEPPCMGTHFGVYGGSISEMAAMRKLWAPWGGPWNGNRWGRGQGGVLPTHGFVSAKSLNFGLYANPHRSEGLMTEVDDLLKLDAPRSLRDPAAISEREALLHAPHIRSLTAYVLALRRADPATEFPYFDPLDGGNNADILFVFEKPGPKTSVRGGGSGFISRNNDDPTADTTFRLMSEARLPRQRTVLWNVIPGWNGTRSISGPELRQGAHELESLMVLLPAVKTVILVGRRAQRALPLFNSHSLRVLTSAHPSPIVRATRPCVWKGIAATWSRAAGADL